MRLTVHHLADLSCTHLNLQNQKPTASVTGMFTSPRPVIFPLYSRHSSVSHLTPTYAVLVPSLWLQIPVAKSPTPDSWLQAAYVVRETLSPTSFFMHLLLLLIGCWSGSEGSAGVGPGPCGHHTWLQTASLTLSVTTPFHSEVGPSFSSVA